MVSRFAGLCNSDSTQNKKTVVTRVYRMPEHEFKTIDTRGWEMEIDFDYSPAYINMAGLRFMGRIEFAPELNAAFWTPDEKDILNTSAFENMFRTYCRLPHRRARRCSDAQRRDD